MWLARRIRGVTGEARVNWSRQAILFEVRQRGSSLAALGRQNRFARNTLHWSTYRPHPRANTVIARFLGVSVHQIWPEWYDERGRLRRRTA